jgi:hypothetical protein
MEKVVKGKKNLTVSKETTDLAATLIATYETDCSREPR